MASGGEKGSATGDFKLASNALNKVNWLLEGLVKTCMGLLACTNKPIQTSIRTAPHSQTGPQVSPARIDENKFGAKRI
jgi:hypothetical protein